MNHVLYVAAITRSGESAEGCRYNRRKVQPAPRNLDGRE